MKHALICIVFVTFSAFLFAQNHAHQQGTIVRMRMTDCMEPQHGFMAAMSGGPKIDTAMQCPEYVLVSEKVVYVISARNARQLLPLAEITRFHLQKNEMLIRADDEPKESRFSIKAMITRSEWERDQALEEAAANAMINHHLDAAAMQDQP